MQRRTTSWAAAMAVAWAVGSAPVARTVESAPPLGAMLEEYARVQGALATDRIDGVATAAAKLVVLAKREPGDSAAKAAASRLALAAGAMTGFDIGVLREQLKELSMALARVVDASGAASAEIFYCPMADGFWLQPKGDEVLRNPYYGKSMPTCGVKVESVED